MQTFTVDHVSPDSAHRAHLIVARATLEIGYRRIGMQVQAQTLLSQLAQTALKASEALSADPSNTEQQHAQQAADQALSVELEFARNYLRTVAYPDYVAAVVEAEVFIDGVRQAWPPSFEQFISWPEEWAVALHDKWGDAVYTLNPHWRKSAVSEEKKRDTDALYLKLTRYLDAQDTEEGKLPDVTFHDLDLAFPLWRLLRGFDYQFPPDVLLKQDEAIMDDLLGIEDAYRRVSGK